MSPSAKMLLGAADVPRGIHLRMSLETVVLRWLVPLLAHGGCVVIRHGCRGIGLTTCLAGLVHRFNRASAQAGKHVHMLFLDASAATSERDVILLALDALNGRPPARLIGRTTTERLVRQLDARACAMKITGLVIDNLDRLPADQFTRLAERLSGGGSSEVLAPRQIRNATLVRHTPGPPQWAQGRSAWRALGMPVRPGSTVRASLYQSRTFTEIALS
jgi:hypothetical protein